MTVSYSNLVATANFSCFLKLLLRWRGSIYKLLWKDFAAFALIFYLLSFTYWFLLTGVARQMFVKIAVYCQEFNNLIPVAFVLGFYVSVVVGRWWEQFKSIPYPSRMALFVSTLVSGRDERARLLRRTIMRYLCLAHVMTMAAISPPVKKRFPSLDNMTQSGFMLPNEQAVLEEMMATSSGNKYFVPLVWAAALVTRARKEGQVKDDFAVKTLVDEINEFRGKCGSLFGFDWVTMPLVYTQVVTIAVYMYFLSCLMGRQFLDDDADAPHGDLYFPFFTFLQFFFYMGWLKVAETLLNPFGEDDDDFDVNGMIDSNLKNSYLVVDEMHDHHPELLKDQYWDSLTFQVPYNEASQPYQTPEFVGSAANIEVPVVKSVLLAPASSQSVSMTTIAEERLGAEELEGAEGRENGGGLDDITATSFQARFKRASKRQGGGAYSRQGSRQAPPSVSRQGSRLSAFFKMGGSRKGSSKNLDGSDPEGGAPGRQNIRLSTLPSADSSAALRRPISITSDLQFQMSDDDLTPTRFAPAPLLPPGLSFTSLDVISETSPLVPLQGGASSSLPDRQISAESSKAIPMNRQESARATFQHGSPQVAPAGGPELPGTPQHYRRSVVDGATAYHPQQNVLASVAEAPETPDAFAGQLHAQLKELREGGRRTE